MAEENNNVDNSRVKLNLFRELNEAQEQGDQKRQLEIYRKLQNKFQILN